MRRLPKVLLLVSATVVVIIALLISGLRLVMPNIDTWREPLQKKISAAADMQITAGSLRGKWESFGPRLEIRNLHAALNDGGHLDIKRVTLALDIWQSLLHLRWQFRDLTFWQFALTTNTPLQGKGQSEGHSDLQTERLNDLFFHQFDHFDLRDSEVSFVTPSGQRARLSVPQLTWLNESRRHRAEGVVSLSSLTGQHGEVQVRLDLRDSHGYLDTGRVWMQADDVDMKPWLGKWMRDNTRLESAQFSLAAWMQIDDGDVSGGDLWLKQGGASWKGSEQSHHLQVDNLTAHISRFQRGWLLELPHMPLRTDKQVWPDGSFSLLWLPGKDKQAEIRIRATEIDLATLNPLAPLFSALPAEALSAWQALKPQGKFQELAADIPLDKPERTRFQARWQDLGWQQWQHLPGMEHLAGTLSGSVADGKLTFDLKQATLPYSPMFRAPLDVQSATGTVNWQYSPNGLTLSGNDMDVQARSLWARGDFRYQQSQGDEPRLDILAGIRLKKAEDAWRYFPEPLMGKALAHYLGGALKGGEVDNATLLFAGNPHQFPFHHNEGMFEVAVPLRNATYQFQPGWPDLQNLNIDLDFANNGLWMHTDGTRLGEVRGDNISAVIPDYLQEKLLIDGDISGEGEQIRHYFNRTPLKTSLGAALDELQIGGNVSGNLHLNIPLDGQQVRATGEARFKRNSLYIKPLNTTFQQLSGSLHYDNGNLQSTLMQSRWFGQPLAVRFNTKEGKTDYKIGVDLQADWQPGVMDVVPPVFRKQLSGHLPWQGKVQITLPQGRDAHYQVDITSNLKNVSSHLPSPLNLDKSENVPVTLTAKGDLNHFDLQGSTGSHQHFNSRWLLDGALRLDRGVWGNASQHIPALPASSVTELNLPALDGEAWVGLLAGMEQTASGGKAGTSLMPSTLRVHTPALMLGGQKWQDLQVTLNHDSAGNTVLNAAGREINGSLTMPRSGSWKGNIDYLYYNPQWSGMSGTNTSSGSTTHIDFSRWPALQLDCKACWLNGQNMGRIRADLTPVGDTLKLANGVIDSEHARLTVNGEWVNRPGNESTSLNGKLSGQNISDAGHWFGVDSPLLDSSFRLNYDLHWPAAPWQPSPEILNGKLKVKLGAGQVADVSTGRAGQILRLVSFDALIRKLRLDFSDTFGQGFWFDSIKGSAKIEKGVMFTDNLLVDGLEADIAMTGKIDLPQHQINMEAVIAPEISATVGVGVAFAVNPVVGVAVFAASQVLAPLWHKISVLRYHIHGSIENPEIHEVLRTPRGVLRQ